MGALRGSFCERSFQRTKQTFRMLIKDDRNIRRVNLGSRNENTFLRNFDSKLHSLHWPAKKISREYISNIQLFSSCWERIWKHFFPITSRLSKKLWQRSKNQQNRLFLDCVYAEVIQQFHYFAYVKCFLRNTFHHYVKFLA